MPKRTAAANAAALPAVIQPFSHQPELRALMMFPTLPQDHMTFPVENDDFYPHLRRGELAVVDLQDRQPANRELFLIGYESPRLGGGHSYAICQTRGKMAYFGVPEGCKDCTPGFTGKPRSGFEPEMCWHIAHWLPPEDPEEYKATLRAGLVRIIDGPLRTKGLASMLVGRIVGVFSPARKASSMRRIGHA